MSQPELIVVGTRFKMDELTSIDQVIDKRVIDKTVIDKTV